MSDMDKHTWTKRDLAEAINQRVDKSVKLDIEYILPSDITDEILKTFQNQWDMLLQPSDRERELIKIYHIIIKDWENT